MNRIMANAAKTLGVSAVILVCWSFGGRFGAGIAILACVAVYLLRTLYVRYRPSTTQLQFLVAAAGFLLFAALMSGRTNTYHIDSITLRAILVAVAVAVIAAIGWIIAKAVRNPTVRSMAGRSAYFVTARLRGILPGIPGGVSGADVAEVIAILAAFTFLEIALWRLGTVSWWDAFYLFGILTVWMVTRFVPKGRKWVAWIMLIAAFSIFGILGLSRYWHCDEQCKIERAAVEQERQRELHRQAAAQAAAREAQLAHQRALELGTDSNCPGGAQTLTLGTDWKLLDPERKCRVVFRVKTGTVIGRDEDEEEYEFTKEGKWVETYVDEFKASSGTAKIIYTLCSRKTSGYRVDWNCQRVQSFNFARW
jgi:hypothetical protein